MCYKLFEEGYDQSIHRSYQQMEKMARDWNDKGYTDIKSLEKQLEINKRNQEAHQALRQPLSKRLNGLDIDRVTSWAEDLDATEELVTLLLKRMNSGAI